MDFQKFPIGFFATFLVFVFQGYQLEAFHSEFVPDPGISVYDSGFERYTDCVEHWQIPVGGKCNQDKLEAAKAEIAKNYGDRLQDIPRELTRKLNILNCVGTETRCHMDKTAGTSTCVCVEPGSKQCADRYNPQVNCDKEMTAYYDTIRIWNDAEECSKNWRIPNGNQCDDGKLNNEAKRLKAANKDLNDADILPEVVVKSYAKLTCIDQVCNADNKCACDETECRNHVLDPNKNCDDLISKALKINKAMYGNEQRHNNDNDTDHNNGNKIGWIPMVGILAAAIIC